MPDPGAMHESARFVALCEEADRLAEEAERTEDFDEKLDLVKRSLALYERAGKEARD